MKIVITNIKSKLVTEDIKLLSLLVRKYSVRKNGYQYSTAYKKYGWDGMVHFFNPDGSFGTGLLESIIVDLEKVGAEYEIEDLREKDSISLVHFKSNISLRDYQQNLYDKAVKKERGIVKLATSGGKTYVMAALASALRDNFGVFIFNKKSLVTQTYDKFQELGIDCGICYGEGEILRPIMLTTIQSLSKIYDQYGELSKFIVFDEIHEMCSGKFSKKVINAFPNAFYRWGFTATPPKDKEKELTLRSSFGETIQEISAKDLIDRNTLARPNIFMIKNDQSVEVDGEIVTELDDYTEEYEKFIVKNEDRNTKIAEIANTLIDQKRKVLIVVKNLEHAEILSHLIPKAVKLEGKDDMVIRRKEIELFRNATEGVCVIGTVIFQTGVDVPEITDVINARGLKSEIATLQLLGRGMRIADGKTQFNYYDFYDNGKYLNKHSQDRAKAYIREGHNVETLQ
jgi:superfamily II DNA or RNA helicase